MTDELFQPAEVGQLTALLAGTCTDCGRTEFPRRVQCPACGGDLAPVDLTGPATLRVETAVLAQPPGSRVEAPYGVGVAEFPEGICVLGLLVGSLTAGAAVDVVVHEPYEGGRIFAFGPHTTI